QGGGHTDHVGEEVEQQQPGDGDPDAHPEGAGRVGGQRADGRAYVLGRGRVDRCRFGVRSGAPAGVEGAHRATPADATSAWRCTTPDASSAPVKAPASTLPASVRRTIRSVRAGRWRARKNSTAPLAVVVTSRRTR